MSSLLSCIFPGVLICSLIWAIFFVSAHLLPNKGRSLRYSSGQGNPGHSCHTVCGGGFREGTMPLASLLSSCPTFCHSPSFPQADCPLSVADSQGGGPVYVLESRGPLQLTLLWAWECLQLPQSPQGFFSQRFWGFIFWHCNPGLCGLSHSPAVLTGLSSRNCEKSLLTATALPTAVQYCLVAGPLCPTYQSGWMFLL